MELTKQQRQKFIENCIKEFIKKFPVEYMAVCESVKKQKKAKKDVFGLVDKDSAYMRWTLRIPTPLFNILKRNLHNPDFLETNEEINWFKKTFSQFRVCEKI